MNWQTRLMAATGAAISLFALGFPLATSAQQAGLNGVDMNTPRLVLDEVIEATAEGHDPAEFVIDVTEPGVLTVAVRAQDDADLRLKVTDRFYQPVLGGEVDHDLGGNMGAEQVVASIPRAGDYRVVVETWGGRGRFRLVSGFVAFPDVNGGEGDEDPDGTPDQALNLPVGEQQAGSLDSEAGDLWDWYRVEAEGDGQLIVTTDAPEGDLVLEAYKLGEYREAVDRSDQDRGGNHASEVVMVDVNADDVVLVKVAGFGHHQAVPRYTVRATLVEH